MGTNDNTCESVVYVMEILELILGIYSLPKYYLWEGRRYYV